MHTFLLITGMWVEMILLTTTLKTTTEKDNKMKNKNNKIKNDVLNVKYDLKNRLNDIIMNEVNYINKLAIENDFSTLCSFESSDEKLMVSFRPNRRYLKNNLTEPCDVKILDKQCREEELNITFSDFDSSRYLINYKDISTYCTPNKNILYFIYNLYHNYNVFRKILVFKDYVEKYMNVVSNKDINIKVVESEYLIVEFEFKYRISYMEDSYINISLIMNNNEGFTVDTYLNKINKTFYRTDELNIESIEKLCRDMLVYYSFRQKFDIKDNK